MSVKFIFHQICFCFVTLLVAGTVFAKSTLFELSQRSYDWGQWQFEVSGNYFSTNANYKASSGESMTLPSGYSYSLLQSDFGFRWVTIPRLGVQVSSQFAYAESKDPIDTRTNSSLTEVNLGADYLLFQRKNYDLLTDLVLSIPLQRVDPQADVVLNHEGSLELEILISGRYYFGKNMMFASSGFIYRDEDRSSLVPYRLGSEIDFGKWFLGADVSGFFSALSDQRNNALQREQVFAKNGNSLKFYSTDPSVTSLGGWLGFKFSPDWTLKAGAKTSVMGSAYASGLDVFTVLAWSPNSMSKEPRNLPESRPQQPSIEFKEDLKDGVDQNLFEKLPPVSNEPLTPPPAPKKPPQSPVDQKKKLQKELDQTEFQIELKSNKKKKKKKR